MAFLTDLIDRHFVQPRVQAQVQDQLAKALNNHPPAFSTSLVKETSLKDAIGQPHDADYNLLYSLYRLNVDVSFGVHAWKGATTSRGWFIDLAEEGAEPSDAQRQEIAEIIRWLAKPNPFWGLQRFLENIFLHLAIVGDYFLYVSQDSHGRPLELWPMHPALTRVVATKQGEILGYVMRSPDGERVVFEPDEVLHFTIANPFNDFSGESPVELVVEEAGIDLMALRSNKAIFANGLKPSVVVVLNDDADLNDAKAIESALKQNHAVAANQHKVAVLSKVKDWKPSSLTHRDLEYLKLRDLSTTKVARAFRMPVFLFGEHNAGDYATAKLLVRETHQNVYIPLQRGVEEIFTQGLITRFNPEYDFNLNRPDASNPDDLRRDYMEAKKLDIMDADEVRELGFGRPPRNLEEPEDDDDQGQEEDDDTDDEATDKRVTKAQEEVRDRREAIKDELETAALPPIRDYFTTQETAVLAAYDAVFKGVAKTDPVTLLSELDFDDDALAIVIQGQLEAAAQAGFGDAVLQIAVQMSYERISPIIETYIQHQSLTHARGINRTTRKALRATLLEGIQGGEGTLQLRDRVQSVYSAANQHRALTIARTETAQAFEYANVETMKASGVVTEEIWLTARDDRVRPSHELLEGARASLGASWTTQGPDGQNISIRPGEEIACRCTSIGVTS